MLSNNAKKKKKNETGLPLPGMPGSKKGVFFQNAEQYMPQHPQKLDLRKQNPVYIPATANFLRLSLIRKKTAFMSAKGEFQEKRGAGMSALLTFRLPSVKHQVCHCACVFRPEKFAVPQNRFLRSRILSAPSRFRRRVIR